METEQQSLMLENMPADYHLIQRLYEQGKLNRKARDYALGLVCPPHKWGSWTANILLKLGLALILAGIVYFFAFNWADLSTLSAFLYVELGILLALFAVYYFGLHSMTGQLSLLAASMLVGVFLAVFGQEYQSGADAYTLFMYWSILIFVWTVMSCFAVQWFFWLVITNIAVVLWEKQFAMRIDALSPIIIIYLGLFNLIMLALREYGLHVKKYIWLQIKWPALLLLGAMLMAFVICINIYIGADDPSRVLMYTAIFSFVAISGLFVYYRHIRFDMAFFATIAFFIAVLIEFILTEMVFSYIGIGLLGLFVGSTAAMSILVLCMGMLTLGLCVLLIKYLRHVSKVRQVI